MRNIISKDCIKKLILMMVMTAFVVTSVADDMGINFEYSNAVKKLTPLSPQAAMIQRFGNYPVDYSTGVPKISIPLYNIKIGDFELPISIDYHNSGIKVQDIATQVGLGWMLNAGGCISVMVKGGYDANDNVPKWETRKNIEDIPDGVSVARKWDDAAYGINGNTESDRYCYNFCGYSGTFRQKWKCLNKKPEFVQLPYSDMKIEMKAKRFSKGFGRIDYTPFVLTDNKGIKYHFDYPEYSEGGAAGGYISMHSVTYYLTKIELPNRKDSIVFHYSEASCYETYSHNESFSISKDAYKYNYNEYRPDYGYKIEEAIILPANHRTTNIHHVTEAKLDSIEWNGNKIYFEYKDDRQEKRTANKGLGLKRLVKAYVNNSEGKNIKNILFDNDFYSGWWEGDFRMFLRSVSICDIRKTNTEIYSFKYNETKLPPYYHIPYPQKSNSDLDCHEDLWGYYNGKYKYSWIPQFPDDPTEYKRNFTDRTPNSFALAGSLVSITYPTGGSTSYEMECNKLDNGDYWGGIRVKTITDYDKEGKVLSKKNYEYKNPSVPFTSDEIKSFYRYQVWDAYALKMDFYSASPTTRITYASTPGDIYASSPCISLTSYYGAPICYNTVTEYYGTEKQNAWFTIRDYIEERTDDMSNFSYEDDPDFLYEKGPFYADYIMPQFYSKWNAYDFGNRRMILQSEKRYNTNGQKIGSVDYYYEDVYLDTVKVGLSIHPIYAWHNFISGGSSSFFWEYKPYEKALKSYIDDNFLFRNIWGIPSYKRLSRRTESKDGITKTTSYAYDEQKRTLKPISEQINENQILTKYTYPYESNDAVSKGMQECNMIVPVKTNVYINGTLSRTDSVAYAQWYNGAYLPTDYYYSLGSGKLEKRCSCTYDKLNRLFSITKDNTLSTMFVWLKKYDFPVAKIDGLTPEILKQKINIHLYDVFLSENIGNIDDIVRSNVDSNIYPVTTYKQEPLVGITRIISPTKASTTFKYDSMWRLNSIFDDKNFKISQYEYNYAK